MVCVCEIVYLWNRYMIHTAVSPSILNRSSKFQNPLIERGTGHISYVGCLLASVRYARKTVWTLRKHRSSAEISCIAFFSHTLQMLTNILRMKYVPFLALLKGFWIFKIGSESKEIWPKKRRWSHNCTGCTMTHDTYVQYWLEIVLAVINGKTVAFWRILKIGRASCRERV